MMPITNERGSTACRRDQSWIVYLPDEALIGALVKRLDGELAAFCRGYLDALVLDDILGGEEAYRVWFQIEKAHWLGGWCPPNR